LPADYLAGLSDSLAERIEWRREHLAQPQDDHCTFVAVDAAGTIVGFVNAGRYRQDEQRLDGIGEIYAIYLTPSAAGTGAGRALMDAAVAWLIGRGLNQIRLWVFEGNARARAFYHRYGFRFDGVRTDYTLERPGMPTVVLPEVRLSLALAVD
jgi:ribosomal protein S18 acetylase RimI-like enzyme